MHVCDTDKSGKSTKTGVENANFALFRDKVCYAASEVDVESFDLWHLVCFGSLRSSKNSFFNAIIFVIVGSL